MAVISAQNQAEVAQLEHEILGQEAIKERTTTTKPVRLEERRRLWNII